MTIQITEILDALRERGINPAEEIGSIDFPDIGEVDEGEEIYATSVDEVFSEDEGDILSAEDRRLEEWWREIEEIITGNEQSGVHDLRPIRRDPPEPHCAWYCPIHFFGHAWGIYIRESCILSIAKDVARAVRWQTLPSPLTGRSTIARQLLRSAFYALYLHEQFHHKVGALASVF